MPPSVWTRCSLYPYFGPHFAESRQWRRFISAHTSVPINDGLARCSIVREAA